MRKHDNLRFLVLTANVISDGLRHGRALWLDFMAGVLLIVALRCVRCIGHENIEKSTYNDTSRSLDEPEVSVDGEGAVVHASMRGMARPDKHEVGALSIVPSDANRVETKINATARLKKGSRRMRAVRGVVRSYSEQLIGQAQAMLQTVFCQRPTYYYPWQKD